MERRFSFHLIKIFEENQVVESEDISAGLARNHQLILSGPYQIVGEQARFPFLSRKIRLSREQKVNSRPACRG
jgi:hypothetical protein